MTQIIAHRARPAPPQGPAFVDRLMQLGDRCRWALFGIIALAYVVGFNAQWRIDEDSALYRSVAHQLAAGAEYPLAGSVQDAVEPALPYLLAGLMQLGGDHEIFLIQTVLLVMSLAALALFYWLVRLHADRPQAVTLVVLLAATHLFYRHAFDLTAQLPFLIGMLVCLIRYERMWRPPDRWAGANWLLFACGLVVTLLSRSAAMTFIGALAVTSLWHIIRGPHRAQHGVIALVVIACAVIFASIDPRRETPIQPVAAEHRVLDLFAQQPAGLAEQIFTDRLPKLFEHATPEALTGTTLGVGFSSLWTLAVVAASVRLVRRRILWGVWLIATFVQMLALYPHERYFVAILPLLLIAIWSGTVRVCRIITEPWSGVSAAAVLVLLLAWNTGLNGRLFIEQRSQPFLEHYKQGRFVFLKDMAEQVRRITPEQDTLVLANDARALSYFSARPTVAPLTREQRSRGATGPQLERLRQQIRRADHFYVVDDGHPSLQWMITNLPLHVERLVEQGDLTLSKSQLEATSIDVPDVNGVPNFAVPDMSGLR